MSLFFTYSAEDAAYNLQPAGYAVFILLILLALIGILVIAKKSSAKLTTKALVFSSLAMALAAVTSNIKFASLPFGGSITLFSMFFICLIGYFYGLKVGLLASVAYGLIQFVMGPQMFSPIQLIIDYPLAFGMLGLSGLFANQKHGLIKGYTVGVLGRYLCHVITGYVFFGMYAPENVNPFFYAFGYNATYIAPEWIITIILISLPPMKLAIGKVKAMAISDHR